MSSKQIDYKATSQELDDIVTALQADTLDVDEAMRQYERGLELVKQLETYLQTAENKLIKLQAKPSE